MCVRMNNVCVVRVDIQLLLLEALLVSYRDRSFISSCHNHQYHLNHDVIVRSGEDR